MVRIILFTGLTATGFTQDSVPLNIGLVVSVDGDGNVKCVLQGFASAGVKHRLLLQLRVSIKRILQQTCSIKRVKLDIRR